MKKLDGIIKQAKSLIDAPYNQFNLDNYKEKLANAYNISINFINTSSKAPIKLMSGQHKHAGIVYSNKRKSKKTIYLIGKGVLFDAGGYNLKSRMNTMKIDMAGLAIAFGLASYFGGDVVAYCPVATNFIHNNQIIPGDIIQIGKKKVEITNTDAEGRLILAEALTTLDIEPNDIVVTIATLTGAVEYAIGSRATGVFGNNLKLVTSYLQSSEKTRELSWRLPMWDYLQKKYFRKRIIKNHDSGGVDVLPGATMGAMFIKQFVKYPNNWLHLDIAGSAYDGIKKKTSGQPIKTLIEFIKRIR